jgi:hypothetical protein
MAEPAVETLASARIDAGKLARSAVEAIVFMISS